MKDICIPVPDLKGKEEAEVNVLIGEKKSRSNYKVVSFPWQVELTDDEDADPEFKIKRLKQNIASYDKNWELIQIFNPDENAKYIKVLYREKIKPS